MLDNWQSKHKGFTVMEMAIVLVISGVLLVAFITPYKVYRAQEKFNDTYLRMANLRSAIITFAGAEKRYPCPSDPTLSINDPMAGIENCSLHPTSVAVGTCTSSGGVCKAAGGRNTIANPHGGLDHIMMGGFPFRTVLSKTSGSGMSMEDVLDGWDNQMTYAVSGYMTDADTFQTVAGAIPIQKEDGGSLITPANSGHYIIVSHGDDGAGAYTIGGVLKAPCPDKSVKIEGRNCNKEGKFLDGLRSLGSTNKYYDDIVVYQAYSLPSLWGFSTKPGYTQDLHNLNPGNVGIGTDAPSVRLEVAGDVRALNVVTPKVCNTVGSECLLPEKLGGGMACSQAGLPADKVSVAVGIEKNNFICEVIDVPTYNSTVGVSCPAGEAAYGVKRDGTLLCRPY